jgi:hypothetical protein
MAGFKRWTAVPLRHRLVFSGSYRGGNSRDRTCRRSATSYGPATAWSLSVPPAVGTGRDRRFWPAAAGGGSDAG